MHGLFWQRALQGKTPAEAYFVNCDNETTTQADINLGIVNIIVVFSRSAVTRILTRLLYARSKNSFRFAACPLILACKRDRARFIQSHPNPCDER